MILRERAAYKAAQILGVSAASVMSEVGKLSSQTHQEAISRSQKEVEKQTQILPERKSDETASRDELVLVCLLSALGSEYDKFVEMYGDEPLETDFTMGSMRTIARQILPVLKEGKLDANRLLLAGDNLILNQRPAGDTLSEALMSVKYGDDVNSLLAHTKDYLYRVRMNVYTKQKDMLAKRLDVMPEGPDRDATESLLRSTLLYLTELKKKMGKR